MFERIRNWIFGRGEEKEKRKEIEEVGEEKPKEVAEKEAGEEEIDYRELSKQTISNIKEKDDEVELDYEKLLEAEKANKNRKTLVEWLENKIEGD
ncbi:hypothetical protein AKJ37_03445 [candidate division MSBL1 archaeon SCGC-AAA259I09]|uniref:Uncharacterized protein n=3 Tax=candidate division MSBL1 TaxID=215777 RepID=A0A133USJ8_9EURY|nr:hypothetical protein AKJ37_03445 [candidate division MSBL1 archaeon SCGC-AAA259I09]KXA98136.1 hypothetical protein AKJ40_04930 [candidate division MSBL1 archaeon SCGC-AAA259M10]KXA98263.1 hypothetical protein AKJ39_02340 [candidate division MSBL1 archaeon SCGC-AAA259J03]